MIYTKTSYCWSFVSLGFRINEKVLNQIYFPFLFLHKKSITIIYWIQQFSANISISRHTNGNFKRFKKYTLGIGNSLRNSFDCFKIKQSLKVWEDIISVSKISFTLATQTWFKQKYKL